MRGEKIHLFVLGVIIVGMNEGRVSVVVLQEFWSSVEMTVISQRFVTPFWTRWFNQYFLTLFFSRSFIYLNNFLQPISLRNPLIHLIQILILFLEEPFTQFYLCFLPDFRLLTFPTLFNIRLNIFTVLFMNTVIGLQYTLLTIPTLKHTIFHIHLNRSLIILLNLHYLHSQ